MANSPNDKFFPVKRGRKDVVPTYTEARCNLFWINSNGNTVRCIHSRKKNHGPVHEYGLHSVRVGEEATVSHEWIDV